MIESLNDPSLIELLAFQSAQLTDNLNDSSFRNLKYLRETLLLCVDPNTDLQYPIFEIRQCGPQINLYASVVYEDRCNHELLARMTLALDSYMHELKVLMIKKHKFVDSDHIGLCYDLIPYKPDSVRNDWHNFLAQRDIQKLKTVTPKFPEFNLVRKDFFT